jgi:hypothetical protein
MSENDRCPFCGAGLEHSRNGDFHYRCGTSGPVTDDNGEEAFNTGVECDKTCFSREVVRLQEENRSLRERNNLILSGLRWTGDGYEWTGAEFDYRLKPDEAVAMMQQQRDSMRSILSDLVDFDRRFPKVITDRLSENGPDHALDAIIDRAKTLLAR